ncbi:heme exporter protein CcmD [Rhizobiaceae bacterium]|nr:heme exporter protein CcmD [Rhizobiaceae bacterium]
MIAAMFGEKYGAYIAGAYGLTAVVLLLLVVWVWAGYRARLRELSALEQAGIRRASSQESRQASRDG